MALPSGTKLGPYEILQPIGAGGMGEVYKAADTRLGRIVAIKIVPAHLSQKPEIKQRFEREAQTIAGLNHPHVCTLYDIGHQDGTDFLVMEFLEGETLAERLAKGALPIDEALRYAIQISDALDKAHGLGVTHRDLKPGNIMLTKSGAKLLDFGLAKFRVPVMQHTDSAVPTVPQDLTVHGTLLGTVQYMAPEQIEGDEVDARTDIFAFGVILYEMITGKKAFIGKSQASLMGSIMERQPPRISILEPLAPPALERVVEICLAKAPENRWQTAHDVMLQLQWIADGGFGVGLPAPLVHRRKNRERFAWLLVAVSVVAALVLAVPYVWKAPQDIRTVRFPVFPTGTSIFAPTNAPLAPFPIISPDGRRLAFVAQEPGDRPQIWVRSLDSMDAQPLPGTEGIQGLPFWSPDSRYIGFAANGRLQTLEFSGGPVQVICSVDLGVEGAWSRDGTIIFFPTSRGRGQGGLYRVSDRGGEPVALSAPNAAMKETSHHLPQFLPDGRHFLYLAQEPNTVYVGSLDTQETKRLFAADSAAIYAPPGYLLYVRQGTLLARAFDAARLEVTGEPFRIAEEVRSNIGNGRAAFSVSNNGTLVYRTGAFLTTQQMHLAWFDRSGKRDDSINQTGDSRTPSLAPDGKRVAVMRVETAAQTDLWIIDLVRGVNSKFTLGATNERDPVWSPNGNEIIFRANPNGIYDLYRKPSTGISSDELLWKSDQDKMPSSWSPDGRFLLFSSNDPKTRGDIWLLPLAGDRKPESFSTTPANEGFAHFSPDGHWVAYTSDVSGTPQIYLQPFPRSGQYIQVTNAGGLNPKWKPDGRELFFIDLMSRKLMAVELKSNGSTIVPGTPTELFQTPAGNNNYDISGDGQRFLFSVPNTNTDANSDSAPITVVLNWAAGLKK
jgi:eukaryotic-like serine/threonine-protein kinase